jgi:hypothetical protein
MRSLVRVLAAAMVAVLVGATGACGAPSADGSLVAQAPNGRRIAVATAGARNVRVLHVDGGSIVRLREVFVPDGEAIAAIGWSHDGRELIVTTRGPMYAVDTQTWRIEPRRTLSVGSHATRPTAEHRSARHRAGFVQIWSRTTAFQTSKDLNPRPPGS